MRAVLFRPLWGFLAWWSVDQHDNCGVGFILHVLLPCIRPRKGIFLLFDETKEYFPRIQTRRCARHPCMVFDRFSLVSPLGGDCCSVCVGIVTKNIWAATSFGMLASTAAAWWSLYFHRWHRVKRVCEILTYQHDLIPPPYLYLFTITASLGTYNPFFYLWILAALVNTIYSATWDVWIDWGLFAKDSKIRFLRNKIIYPRKVS